MSTDSESQSSLSRIYSGWVMVAVTFFLTALSFGGMGAIGVFLKPIASEFGWGRGETALGHTALTIGSALMGPVWGYLADKHGSRRLAFMGIISISLTTYLQSYADSLWHFYLCYLLFGSFGFSALSSPLVTNVGFWFKRNPGIAIGLAIAGGAFGQATIPFLARLLIDEYSWQAAYQIIAVLFVAIGLPLCFLVRESPSRIAAQIAPKEPSPKSTVFPLTSREVLFWLCPSVTLACICMSTPLVHLISMISDGDISAQTATSVFMVLMIVGIPGRIVFGRLTDVLGALPSFMLASFFQAVIVLSFPHITTLAGYFVMAALFGIAYSGVMTSFMVCARTMIQAKVAARSLSTVNSFAMIGMGTGSFMGGFVFDHSNSYLIAFTIAGISGLVSLSVLVIFQRRIHRQTPRLKNSP